MGEKVLAGSLTRWAAADRRKPAVPSPRVLTKLVVPLALLAFWQVLVEREVYSRSQLPAPLDVYRAARQMAEIELLWPNIQISLERVAQGFVIGSLVAIVLGLLVGLSKLANEMLEPTIQAIRAVPSLAWVPMLVLWMGIDERPKITLVAIGVFFPVFANLVSGIRQVDRKLVEAAAAYGMHGVRLGWEVLLPASLPSLLTGLRLGLAQGWLFLVAAELIGANTGLGFLLTDGQNTGRSDIIVLSIIILAVIGKTSDWLLQIGEKRLLRWTDTYGK
ncbi:MAG: ABC transporter permease [Thermomicrobiales bacterium]